MLDRPVYYHESPLTPRNLVVEWRPSSERLTGLHVRSLERNG